VTGPAVGEVGAGSGVGAGPPPGAGPVPGEGDQALGDDDPGDILATEVFSAIQGEAALVGTRQVFVRLTGCNIRCAYCDQPEALERAPGPCRVERTPGRRDWETVASPLPVTELVAGVERLWSALPHHSVSLTGGEPLLQTGRVTGLVRLLAEAGWPVMLETNGTLVAALERVLPWLAYVSVDLKLPSVDGERVRPGTQERFLRAAVGSGATTWAKVVIGASTDTEEFDRAIAAVAAAADACPGRPRPEVFLQPVTPFAAVTRAPSPDQVLELHERALRRYPSVRVVPQTHKAIGQL
jgi:7-carboxy-7-deazaguanine synthase